MERLLALLPRSQPVPEADERYLFEAADFCDLERRMRELRART
jgi:hypothetical protein